MGNLTNDETTATIKIMTELQVNSGATLIALERLKKEPGYKKALVIQLLHKHREELMLTLPKLRIV